MLVVLRQMIGHTGDAGMHICAAQLLCAHLLAGSRLHQRRPAQEDCPRPLHNHRFVAHRRHVGPARGAASHHRGDLGNPRAAHPGLVVEDAPEVVHIREDLVLHRQECAAGVHQIETGQVVFQGDLLGAQVLFDGHRVVGPAFDSGVVGDDHHLPACHPPDAGDDARAGRVAVV